MGWIQSLFSENTGGVSTEKDFSAMSRAELNAQFLPSAWSKLDYNDRCRCLQELENRFAQEQGRPAAVVTTEPMEGGRFGGWRKETNQICINESFVRDGRFTTRGIQGREWSDASFQIYDTIAHEGYHAYQSYALAHPEIHADKVQLEQWRLNSAETIVQGHYESNYYTPSSAPERYRLQALERDAFEYGNRSTRNDLGSLIHNSEDAKSFQAYLEDCEYNSYQNTLRDAQRVDPDTLQHMDQEMKSREQAWAQGLSCGEIGTNSAYNLKSEPIRPEDENRETVNPPPGFEENGDVEPLNAAETTQEQRELEKNETPSEQNVETTAYEDMSAYELDDTASEDISVYELDDTASEDMSAYEQDDEDISAYELDGTASEDMSAYELDDTASEGINAEEMNSSEIETVAVDGPDSGEDNKLSMNL